MGANESLELSRSVFSRCFSNSLFLFVSSLSTKGWEERVEEDDSRDDAQLGAPCRRLCDWRNEMNAVDDVDLVDIVERRVDRETIVKNVSMLYTECRNIVIIMVEWLNGWMGWLWTVD